MSMINPDPDYTTAEHASDESSSLETNTAVIVSTSSIKSEKTVGGESNSASMSGSSAASMLTSSVGNASLSPETLPISEDSNISIQFNRLDFDTIAQDAARTGTYRGALVLMATEVSVIAALISAIAFVAHWPSGVPLPNWLMGFIGTPLLLGTVPTLILWLLLALILRRSTAVDRMNMSSYGELLNHLSALEAQLMSLACKAGTIPARNGEESTNEQLPRTFVTNVDIKEVLEYRDTICKKLAHRSQGWVTAVGYVELWREMHSAEAALIDIMPLKAVIAGALGDELRIQGSNIGTSAELLKKLRLAVQILDPAATIYLQSPLTPPADTQGETDTADAVVNGIKRQVRAAFQAIEQAPDGAMQTDDSKKRQARAVLRTIKQMLNDFRDDRWQAIVSLRNQFVSTTIFTGITMYGLLQFALLAGALQSAIISATAFYLVGALVGLFGRLLSESQTSKAVDDYRLAMVRLAALPLYCGLAAVGGVLFVQRFTSSTDVFDPKNLLSSLVIAAGFGLTPNLLVDKLQEQIDKQKDDIKSTTASHVG